ncbi:MAG: alcohol dehydrogenase catalytic domain-containing protein [Planctomycetota bacterium]|nr:alcohol dehydrogenase catalytic domain-containing protein [Planctomycetota bacterium]
MEVELLSTSRAVVFVGAGKAQLQELELPRLDDGEVLVKVDCCTLCGSDLHTLTVAREEPTLSILAHEIIGKVVAVSNSSMREFSGAFLQPGDRVTWSVVIGCDHCERCRNGLPQKYLQLAKYGHALAEGRHWPGDWRSKCCCEKEAR